MCHYLIFVFSGKTCAFLLPMMTYILPLPRLTPHLAESGPYAIVLAPTRELAQQIDDECENFARPLGIRHVSIVGGLSYDEQLNALNGGVEIISKFTL